MRRHLVRIVAASALLTLSACSSSDDSSADPAAPEAAASGRAGAADGPAYQGPDLPGLAAKPVWSVPRESTTETSTTVIALGAGTVAVANVVGPEPTTKPAYGTSSVSLRQQTVELRDVATGAVRKKLNVYGEVSGETWLGTPAIVVRGQQPRTAADPDTERPWLIEAYDERGERLGGGEVPGLGREGSILQDGWVLTPSGGAFDDLVVRRVGDTGPGQRMTCSVRDNCSYARARGEVYVVAAGAESKAMAAGAMFKYERAGDTWESEGGKLVAFDPATGARRWATDTLVRPQGAEPASNVTADGPEVLGSLGGKVVISWDATGPGDTRVVGLYDPLTGAPAGTGPSSPAGALFAIADAEGAVAVLATHRDDSLSTAWETGSGKTLWQQAKGDKPLVPVSIVGGILWANSGNPVALDARTGKVVAQEPELTLSEEGVPTPVGPRHAFVIIDRSVYVFETQA